VAELTGGSGTAPPPAKRNVKTRPLPSLYFGICYSFDFSRLLFFAFFGVFSSDFGFLYSRSIPNLLLFLHCFLSVGQWAPFSLLSRWLKPYSFALMFANGWFTACDGFYGASAYWLSHMKQ